MLRTLLTTTAIATLLVGGAVAQDAPANTMDTNTTAMDAEVAVDPAMNSSILATGYTVVDTDNLTSEIMGMPVYGAAGEDAEQVGDINNLVIAEDGTISAVVLGVGGFLGIGEKTVAVNYDELQWTTDEDGELRLVLPTTKEALEAAPDFEAVDRDDMADDTMATDTTMATDDNAMATDTTVVEPANDTAMAPAADTTGDVTAVDTMDQPVTGPIDRTTLTDAAMTAEELIGTNAYGPNDEHLGAIGDVVLGEDGATVEAVIIDFGGFLGIGTKPVAVSVDNLSFALDESNNRYLFVNVTREQLDAAVAFDADTYPTDRDQQLLTTEAAM